MPLESWIGLTIKARRGNPYAELLEDPTSLNTHITLKLETMFLLKILLKTDTLIFIVIQSIGSYVEIIYYRESFRWCFVSWKAFKKEKKMLRKMIFSHLVVLWKIEKKIKHIDPWYTPNNARVVALCTS